MAARAAAGQHLVYRGEEFGLIGITFIANHIIGGFRSSASQIDSSKRTPTPTANENVRFDGVVQS